MQRPRDLPAASTATGVEWLVDAYGCTPEALGSVAVFEQLFARIVAALELRPVAPPVWHRFSGAGGLTGLLMLSESHLACHTFPERTFAAGKLYCCRARDDWNWTGELERAIGARRVVVRRFTRGADPADVSDDAATTINR
jgi:S-adenosylmethionine decarboxylase